LAIYKDYKDYLQRLGGIVKVWCSSAFREMYFQVPQTQNLREYSYLQT